MRKELVDFGPSDVARLDIVHAAKEKYWDLIQRRTDIHAFTSLTEVFSTPPTPIDVSGLDHGSQSKEDGSIVTYQCVQLKFCAVCSSLRRGKYTILDVAP